MSFEDAEIHRGISESDYHNWPANRDLVRGAPEWRLSRTELSWMLESGEMFLAGGPMQKSETPKSNKSIAVGSIVDAMLLRPDLASAGIKLHPATYQKEVTKGRGAAKTTVIVDLPWSAQSNTCKAWKKDHQKLGWTVVSEKDIETSKAAAFAVRSHWLEPGSNQTIQDLIDAAEKQLVVTADWTDEPSGLVIPMRCMIDICFPIPEAPVLYDVKTAKDASHRKFGFSVRDYHYDIQSWMYGQMLASYCGYDRQPPFGFIVVRNTKPHLVATYAAKPATLQAGEEKFRKAMRSYCDSLAFGKWRGYTIGWEEI